MSRARVYADVNVHKPREYWDYENLTVHWGCAPSSALSAPTVASSPSAWPPCRGRGPSVIAELLLRTAGTRRTTS